MTQKLLGKADLADLPSRLPNWTYDAKRKAITRRIRFGSFREAITFMWAVATVADDRNHHPEWSNVYDVVDIALTTHDEGGVTTADVELASAMDEIAVGFGQAGGL